MDTNTRDFTFERYEGNEPFVNAISYSQSIPKLDADILECVAEQRSDMVIELVSELLPELEECFCDTVGTPEQCAERVKNIVLQFALSNREKIAELDRKEEFYSEKNRDCSEAVTELLNSRSEEFEELEDVIYK